MSLSRGPHSNYDEKTIYITFRTVLFVLSLSKRVSTRRTRSRRERSAWSCSRKSRVIENQTPRRNVPRGLCGAPRAYASEHTTRPATAAFGRHATNDVARQRFASRPWRTTGVAQACHLRGRHARHTHTHPHIYRHTHTLALAILFFFHVRAIWK